LNIVCGLHSVRLALERNQVRRLLLDGRRRDRRCEELRALAAGRGVPVVEVHAGELERLAEGVRHQGAVAEIEGSAPLSENQFETWLEQARNPLLLVLDGIEDPRNLGACLRAADGAGADAVVMPRRRAAGLTPAVRKTASGAAEALRLFTVTNLARVLDVMGECNVLRVGAVLDPEAAAPWKIDLRGPLAMVLGSEERGLRRLTRDRMDALVALPMHGAAESLNVAVACGVLLYEALRQRIET
jgi:23S rRNA (guanosine2251-2'-O)-methyltransferase